MSAPAVTVTTHSVSSTFGKPVAVTSMVSVTDPSQAVAKYTLTSTGGHAGHFLIGNQDFGTSATFSATDIGSVYFYPLDTVETDTISVTVLDNGNTPLAATSSLKVAISAPPPPTITVKTSSVTGHISTDVAQDDIALSSLFSLTDPNEGVDSFKLIATGAKPGYFVVNGMGYGSSAIISVSDLGSVYYRAGFSGETDTISIQAFDSTHSTQSTAKAATAIIQGPTLTLPQPSVATTFGQTVAFSSLVSVKDQANDITMYTITPGSNNAGSLYVNGVVVSGTVIIQKADLANLVYVARTSAGSDTFSIFGTDDGLDVLTATKTETIVVTKPPLPTVSLAHTAITAVYGQEPISASSLFTAKDPQNRITEYSFWDKSTGPNAGHFVVNGNPQDPGQQIEVAASDLASVAFVAGKGGTDTIAITASDAYGTSTAQTMTVTVKPPAPSVSVSPTLSLGHGSSLNASSLFEADDPNGISFVKYSFLDSSTSATAGHFVLNGVVEANGTAFTVTADQLSQLQFVAGEGTDAISIRANDGFNWSNTATAKIITPIDSAPVVTGTNTQLIDESRYVSQLFSVTDAEHDAITKYQFQDLTGTAKIQVLGTILASPTSLVTVSSLSYIYFIGGAGLDQIRVRAWDGLKWGAWGTAWVGRIVTDAGSGNVTAAGSTITASHGQSFAASDLFTVETSAENLPTRYQFEDLTPASDSGYFTVQGATGGPIVEAASTIFSVNATALGSVNFHTGSGSDQIMVRAYDGTTWSNWTTVTIAAPQNNKPVVTLNEDAPLLTAPKTSISVSTLFSVQDQDNDGIVKYQVEDVSSSGGGLSVTSGNTTSAFATGTVATVTDLNSVKLSIGTGFETIQVRAFDGLDWGAWTSLTVGYAAPTISIGSDGSDGDGVDVNSSGVAATEHLQSIAAQDLFTVNTSHTNPVKYQFVDNTATAGSGYFLNLGDSVSAGTIITTTDLSSVYFQTGGGTDSIQVRAYDGTAWSAWKTISVTGMNAPPTVSALTSAYYGLAGSRVQLTSLFAPATDNDDDPVLKYQVQETTTGGILKVGSSTIAAGTAVNVAPSALGSVTFTTGSGLDTLEVRAWDGLEWGAWTKVLVGYAPPVVSAGNPADGVSAVGSVISASSHRQSFAASDLFTVNDPEGASTITYRLVDTSTASGHGGFITGPAPAVSSVTTTDLNSVSFQTGIGGTDVISVQVNNGGGFTTVKTIAVSAFDTAPIVSTGGPIPNGNTTSIVGMFSVSDPDGDQITKLQIQDVSGTGTLKLNGVVEAKGTAFIVANNTSALSSVTINAGKSGDTFEVRAWDGAEWGDWTHIAVINPAAPAPLAAPVAAPLPTLASSLAGSLGSNAVVSNLATSFDLGKHQWGLGIPS